MAKVIFLTGAPESETLTWDERTLLQTFQSPIRRFLGEHEPRDNNTRSSAPAASLAIPKWRLLSCTSSHPITDSGAPGPGTPPGTPFYQTQFLAFDDNDTSTQRGSTGHLSFLRHSLVLLTARETSLVVSFSSTTTSTSTSSPDSNVDFSANANPRNRLCSTLEFPQEEGDLLHSTPKPLHQHQQQHQPPAIAEVTCPITDLAQIPSASHVLRIHPQTMTINLIATIIKIEPTRTVDIRKWDTQKSLIEVLVGDETRSNFSITFWLPASNSQNQPTSRPPDLLRSSRTTATANEAENLHNQLRELGAGDVVLMQNVALSVYRGAVYGQSLSRSFARRSCTRVGVLGNEEGAACWGAAGGKVQRVREWSEVFVGRGRARDRGGGGSAVGNGGIGDADGELGVEELPGDMTQSG